jgi:hypothetical protein
VPVHPRGDRRRSLGVVHAPAAATERSPPSPVSRMNKPDRSESGVPAIPRRETMPWADGLAGRRARRETRNRVAPEVIRRPTGPDDARLRRLDQAERGLPFRRTEELGPAGQPCVAPRSMHEGAPERSVEPRRHHERSPIGCGKGAADSSTPPLSIALPLVPSRLSGWSRESLGKVPLLAGTSAGRDLDGFGGAAQPLRIRASRTIRGRFQQSHAEA